MGIVKIWYEISMRCIALARQVFVVLGCSSCLSSFSVAALFACGSWALAAPEGITALAGDMTTFDPDRQVFPTSGDRIKVAVFFPFSGPAAINGHLAWTTIGWPVHDVNTQGGIWVDGSKKKIQLIKANHQGKPSTAKRVLERMCLREEVDVIIGTSGSQKIGTCFSS